MPRYLNTKKENKNKGHSGPNIIETPYDTITHTIISFDVPRNEYETISKILDIA